MFKRVFTLASLLLLFGLFNSVSSSFAKETTGEDNVETARNYIENNVVELNEILKSMKEKQEDYDLQEIQAVIDNYYTKNPAPKEVLNDKTLSIDDVFPLKNEKRKASQEKAVLNFEELLSHAKEHKNEGDSVYEFSNKDGIVTVYVSKTGEVMILDDSVKSTPPALDLNINNQLAAMKTTKTKRTTGIAYNGLGLKMFTIWAEGNFQYNGKSAKHANADGDVKRHFWGSTLVLNNRAIGAKRTVTVGSYKYPEVYTRVYFEAQFGIRWAGITMKSGTVEAYVGSSHIGSLYGGTKKL